MPITVFLKLGIGERRATRQMEARQSLRLRAVDETHRLNAFFGEQRCHAGVKRLAQIRSPTTIRWDGMQKILGASQHRFKVAKFLHRLPGHTKNERQVVSGVRKRDRSLGSFFVKSFLQQALKFIYDRVCAANGACCDITTHFTPPYNSSAFTFTFLNNSFTRASPLRPNLFGS